MQMQAHRLFLHLTEQHMFLCFCYIFDSKLRYTFLLYPKVLPFLFRRRQQEWNVARPFCQALHNRFAVLILCRGR